MTGTEQTSQQQGRPLHEGELVMLPGGDTDTVLKTGTLDGVDVVQLHDRIVRADSVRRVTV